MLAATFSDPGIVLPGNIDEPELPATSDNQANQAVLNADENGKLLDPYSKSLFELLLNSPYSQKPK